MDGSILDCNPNLEDKSIAIVVLGYIIETLSCLLSNVG